MTPKTTLEKVNALAQVKTTTRKCGKMEKAHPENVTPDPYKIL